MTVTRYPSIVSADGTVYPVIDPWRLYSGDSQAPQDFLGRANSISCPAGTAPGSAFFVVTRGVNDTLDMNVLYSLKWLHENGTTTWQKYCIVRQWFVGVDGDGKSAALVELRDKRQLMMGANNWQYNVRRHSGGTWSSSSSDVSQYYADSLNAGALYTWQGIFDDLWLTFPSTLRGTAPTLPYIPLNKPENFKNHGSSWDAVADLLARCQSKLILDPIADTFSVVRVGAEQTGLADAVAALADRVMFDATPRQNLLLASMPEKIQFFFPKYGTPSQTDDGGQTVRPYYTIEKPTNLEGAQAGTVKPYVTSFHAVYNSQADADKANYPPANDSILQNLATELAEKIADKIDLGTERGRIIWSGIAETVLPGSEVGNVQWRDLGGDEGCVTDARTADGVPDGQVKVIEVEPSKIIATPTIAVLTSSIAANAWSSVSMSAGTPTTGTGNIVGMVDGTLQTIESGATIYNPLPFSFQNSTQVRVAYNNGAWVVLGPATSLIHSLFYGDTLFPSGSDFLDWSSGGDNFGIATYSGDTITITCPLAGGAFNTLAFRIEWNVLMEFAGATASLIGTSTSLLKNGIATGGTTSYTLTGVPADVTGMKHHHHCSREIFLGQGDTLKIALSIPSAGLIPSIDGDLTITPLMSL